MRLFRQYFTLARLTAVEAVRQPVTILLMATSIFFTALVPFLLLHEMGEDGKIARDSGLAFQFVFGLVLSCYVSCSSLSEEMRRGTALAVLSKPVSRNLFFLSKYTGVAAVIAAYSFCSVIASLLAERVSEHFIFDASVIGYFKDDQLGLVLIAMPFLALLGGAVVNYIFRRSFQSSAFFLLIFSMIFALCFSLFFDRYGNLTSPVIALELRIIPAGILVALALLVIAAITLALSSRLSFAPTMAVAVILFLTGLTSDYFFGAHADTSLVCRVAHGLLPNWQHFWQADMLNDGGHITASYLLNAAGYAVSYGTGILFIGLYVFRRSEVK